MKLHEHPQIKALATSNPALLLEIIGILAQQPPGIPSSFINPLGIAHFDRAVAKVRRALLNHEGYLFGKYFDAICVCLKFGVKFEDFLALVRTAKNPKALYDGFVTLAGDNYNPETIAAWNEIVATFPFENNQDFWGANMHDAGLAELQHGGFSGYDDVPPSGTRLTTAATINPVDELADVFDSTAALEKLLTDNGLTDVVEAIWADVAAGGEGAETFAREKAAQG